jgi:pimeloyl-ACP methyl ester carboxylesterase
MAGPPASLARPELPPFVSARLDQEGRLVADPRDSGTYILKALDQGDWYRRLLAFPAPHSVAISTRTMRIGGSWGAKGSAAEALSACGGAASGCRVYLDRDRVVWTPERADPVPAALVPGPLPQADTATLEGALTGAEVDRAGCQVAPDAVWVEAEGYRACLRYRHGGLQARNPTALLLLDGDEVFPLYARGRPEVTGVAAIDTLMAERDTIVARRLEAIATRAGLPFVLLKRPGTGGSTGNQWREGKTVRETALVDAALAALAQRHGIARWAVAGQSGGAAVAANLLARRGDIACAALGSGPLALQAQLAFQGADRALLGDLDDPIRHVDAIAADPSRRIFVLSDEADRLVPFSVQRPWVERAGARGLAVEHLARQGWGGGPLNHDLTWQAVEVASLCAGEVSTAEIAARAGGGIHPAVAALAQVAVGG